jgi:hypothetical protein
MNMPGFAAEAALFNGNGRYQGFRAEASLKSAIQMTNWSSNDRPNADQADVSGIAPAFWSCLQARMDCAEDPNNLWIPNSRLRCGGFCAYW